VAKQWICLRAIDGKLEGKTWQSDGLLRIGRSAMCEIVLNDTSISRRHAEIVLTDQGWVVRDLGSTNGTFVNGIRVGWAERKLHERDVLQCGNVVLTVVALQQTPLRGFETPVETLQVQATTRHSWEEALEMLASDFTRQARPGEQLLSLIRVGHFFYQATSFEELFQVSLEEAVTALRAQRGSVLLFNEATQKLKLSAVFPRDAGGISTPCYSNTLAQRCFRAGESLLCRDTRADDDLLLAKSVLGGAMNSIICALLRTPTIRLGVLHLDRGVLEEPFTTEDLHLADAVAASLSASFASAQLLQEKQRNVFIQTVLALAQALALRDPYTSGHAQRVTDYALILADQLQLEAADIRTLQVGAPLHDLGKIGIEDRVLRKEGVFTTEEHDVMKEHSAKGAALLETIPDLAMTVPMIRSHHERWDGAGYPDGLRGEEIPLLARVVAVADTFDALTFDQHYRKAVSAEEAFAVLEEESNKQFDPELVRAFLQARPRIKQVLHQHHSLLHLTDTLGLSRQPVS